MNTYIFQNIKDLLPQNLYMIRLAKDLTLERQVFVVLKLKLINKIFIIMDKVLKIMVLKIMDKVLQIMDKVFKTMNK